MIATLLHSPRLAELWARARARVRGPWLGSLLAAALVLLLAPPDAAANPLDAFGFGSRGIALGGAMTANARDNSANYYNPAGLAMGHDLRIEFGYVYVQPHLEMNGGNQNVDRSYGVQAGVVMPGRILKRNVAVSVGLHLPAERVSRIRALPQRQPHWVIYDNRPQRIVITSSAAFAPIEQLSFGFGVTYLSNTEGSLDMSGLASLSDADLTAFFSGVDVDLVSVRYFSAGVMYQPTPNWRFGIAFRDEFKLKLDLDVDVRGDIAPVVEGAPPLVEDATFLLNIRNTSLFSPRQLSFGATYERPKWMATADVTWLQWSRFPSPASTIDIDLELGVLPFTVPPGDTPIPPGFHDIVIPRVGAEVELVSVPVFALRGRAGYFFEASPAPDQPGATNYVDAHKHGVSGGLGFEFREFSTVFRKPILIDFGGQYIALRERAYHKTDPADPVGDFVAAGHLWGFNTNLSLLF